MKKFYSLIAICLVVCLSIPSIHARAYSGDFYVSMKGSQDLYSDRLYTAANYLYRNSPDPSGSDSTQANFNSVSSFLSSNYSSSELLIFGGNLLSPYSSVNDVHFFDGVTNGRIFLFGDSSSGLNSSPSWVLLSDSAFTYGMLNDISGGASIGGTSVYSRSSVQIDYDGQTFYGANSSDLFFANSDTSITITSPDSNNGQALGGKIDALCYCSMPIYTVYEDDSISITSSYSRIAQMKFILGDYDLTPLNDPVNAFTSDGYQENYETGVVPDPAPQEESNLNHMYFESCDLGFAEPYGINDFSRFGGAYLFCRYSVDNWVVDNISDYSLRFTVVSVIGSQQNNFSYTMRLDRNGLVTIPFSDLFSGSSSTSAIPINNSFVAMVSSQKLNSDYNIAHLYSLSESKLTNWLNANNSKVDYSITGLGWSMLSPDASAPIKYIAAWVKDSGTSSINNGDANDLVAINPYILRIGVSLIDNDSNSSGEYAEKFDLYTGDQSTVDTDGLTNSDPYVPDIVPDDPDSLPVAPSDPNSTTPSVIINTGGTWTGSFNGVIGFDPGYTDLKNDLNSNKTINTK